MSRGGRDIGADGLTDTERAIMDLHDTGLRPAIIAIRLQLAFNYVDRVVRLFQFSEAAEAARDDRIRRASVQLAAACAATGSCFR